ncbi:Pentulose kinase [Hyaloscypha variabilis]
MKLILRAMDDQHYIGVDVGTGSARACVVNQNGDIIAVASKDIRTWRPSIKLYEQSTSDIWRSISFCVKHALQESGIDLGTVLGIGFCATCSLAVFSQETDKSISVNGPNFDKVDQNVILWLDHRPVLETDKINKTGDEVLKYVGGKMSVEMEIPKILWLKNHMPPELFNQCKFYDLVDALTHMATGSETRSYCSTVCKQGYLPDGVEGNHQGWKDDFFEAIGLGCFKADGYSGLGGINGKNGTFASAGDRIGTLSESAANDLGLPAGIPVGSGVIDAYAGWIGTVGAEYNSDRDSCAGISQALGRLALVAGTSTCRLLLSKDLVFVDGVWGPYRDVLIPGLWMAEAGQSATGKLLEHMLEMHPAYNDMLAAIERDESPRGKYDWLNDRLGEMARSSHSPSIAYLGRHLHFYGDLFGNRSPFADANMTGTMVVLEFIALQTRHIIEAMKKAGLSVLALYICGMSVMIPQYESAAVVHGAAMLGAMAASGGRYGQAEDLWDIMWRMSKPGTVVLPSDDRKEKKLLDVKYRIFLEQFQTQIRYRQEVNEAVGSV